MKIKYNLLFIFIYHKKHMSRCNRDAIFTDYVGNPFENYAKCPICSKVIKRETLKGSEYEWHRGHIYPVSLKGPDTYANLIPLCAKCNRSMTNKNMFDYLLELGKFSPDEARYYDWLYKKRINDFDVICSASALKECKVRNQRFLTNTKTSGRCKNLKYGYQNGDKDGYCKRHQEICIDWMDIVT